MRQKLFSLLLATVFGAQLNISVYAKPEIWFGGVDPVTASTVLKSKNTDFVQLFYPESDWQRSSSRLNVFKISMQFAISGKEEDLVNMLAYIKQKNISLAIEMGMLRADRGCGRGEGYMPKETLHAAMRRLKRLDAQLKYVVADEVVYFGKYNNFPSSKLRPCHDSIEEIAHEVAESVDEIHQYFPDAEIGFAEPLGGNTDRFGKPVSVDQKSAIADYLRFADVYETISGKKFSFFQADVAWRTQGWKTVLARMKGGIQSRGIRFGIIIGGNPNFADDVSWTRAGLDTLSDLYKNPATSPGYVIIQSWQPNPSHYLPEHEQGTSTWMLLQAEKMADTVNETR